MKNILKEFIEESKDLNLHNVVVLQHEEKIAEYNWCEPIRHPQYSITKSFTSVALGIAIEEGLISINETVYGCLQEEMMEGYKKELIKDIDGWKNVEIKHLLTMTMGTKRACLMEKERREIETKRWLATALNQKLESPAGSKFIYTNSAPYIIGSIIAKKSKMSLKEYLMPRLFEPLEILEPEWEKDGHGNEFASSGMKLTTEELSRFGQMLLNKGAYKGKHIVSSNWVDEISRHQVGTRMKGEDYDRYGYYFWLCRNNSYRADGKWGQMCIVINDKNAVIAINSNEEKDYIILQNIWESIYQHL